MSLMDAGILEEKIFEADPNIKYTFAWDRMNIYRQRVYGVTTANIKVGWEPVLPWLCVGLDLTLAIIKVDWNQDKIPMDAEFYIRSLNFCSILDPDSSPDLGLGHRF